ncbi:MAG: M23 family metallopeptidase [Muribaculaceae bacterium]|nr:M23 family metallopeptidase [Muribaculaceae bacterium]
MKKHPSHKNAGDNDYKLRGSWKLTIVDLNRLRKVWEVRLTRQRVIAAAGAMLLLSLALGVLLITFTPFSLLLPGYLNRDSRNAYEHLNLQTDSLNAVVANQTVYLENLMAVLRPDPDVVENPVIVTEDSIHLIPVDSLLPTSKIESDFVKQHEQEEKYKLSVLSPLPSKILPFVNPVKGAVIADGSPLTQVQLNTPAGASVNSCYGGRVIASYYSQNGGATVIVQHPLNFISVYRGMDRARVSDGDKVTSGQSLGNMSQSSPTLQFELWLDGDRVNPADYILF